jgi:hypothetical protein
MKKYNIVILLVLVFSLTTSQSFAQKGAPGLYGKRLFVEFGTAVSTSAELPRYNENNRDGYRLDNLFDGVDIPLTLNFNYQLSAHYAISRLSTAGLGVSYGRTGMETPNDNNTINANIHSTNLNVFIRSYYISNGSIAPLGRYAQFGISAMINNRTFTQSSLFYTDPQEITSQTFVSPAINLEFGRETIINDILLYSFAFQTTLTLPYGMDEASRYDGVQGDIGDTMFTRLLSYYSFRFKFAVGLPFKVQK